MKQMPLVSIIIPIYNAQEYLDICVESALAQTYPNIELILVDDGSPDASGTICDAWAEKDVRIKVIHQENTGVSGARNAGISAAQGKYVCFADSDDTMSPDAVMLLWQHIQECDCSIGSYNIVDAEHRIQSQILPNAVFTRQEFQKAYASVLFHCYTPCAKLYKKCLIDDNTVRFDTSIAMGEDVDFNMRYFACAQTISTFSNVVYCYQKFLSTPKKCNGAWKIYLKSIDSFFGLRERKLTLYEATLRLALYLEDMEKELCEKVPVTQRVPYFTNLIQETGLDKDIKNLPIPLKNYYWWYLTQYRPYRWLREGKYEKYLKSKNLLS